MLNVIAMDTEHCSTLENFSSCSAWFILEFSAARKTSSGDVRFLRQMWGVFYQHFVYLMHHLVLDTASEGYLSVVWLYRTASAVTLFGETYFARGK